MWHEVESWVLICVLMDGMAWIMQRRLGESQHILLKILSSRSFRNRRPWWGGWRHHTMTPWNTPLCLQLKESAYTQDQVEAGNLAKLQAKAKAPEFCLEPVMLFVDKAAVWRHTEGNPQSRSSQACLDFRLKMSLKRARDNMLIDNPPTISICSYVLGVIRESAPVWGQPWLKTSFKLPLNKRAWRGASCALSWLTMRVRSSSSDGAHQTASLQSVRPQHAPLKQWIMDYP